MINLYEVFVIALACMVLDTASTKPKVTHTWFLGMCPCIPLRIWKLRSISINSFAKSNLGDMYIQAIA